MFFASVFVVRVWAAPVLSAEVIVVISRGRRRPPQYVVRVRTLVNSGEQHPTTSC